MYRILWNVWREKFLDALFDSNNPFDMAIEVNFDNIHLGNNNGKHHTRSQTMH
jgi:hypothetical protein